MPSSAHRCAGGVLLAALLALFCVVAGGAAPAGQAAGPAPSGRAFDRAFDRASADGAGRVSAGAGDGAEAVRASAARQRADADASGRGPWCGPGPAGPERVPAVPARAGAQADHVLAGCARPLPGCAPPAACAVSGPPGGARAPDRPAPGPLELSVMRV
ncbi:hypothetical protein [Streptomyces sp. 2P-4]|uniref:hypothetical protein n=1 Tax=Streptomyces sp. 2P-4 TaxID=2931974 RepID=UPI002541020C|nr:hypothetical protein [Streptomyces sp. 2P-4]